MLPPGFHHPGPGIQTEPELWSPSGLPMTQNPFFVEAADSGLRAYFMPEDDRSTIYVYDLKSIS